jgi:RNA polymerase sigma factor CnrH
MNPAPGERDDAALVAAALAGEDRAFTELMRRHKDPIYRFVRRYVGDADEAFDLVQETFVAAWSALSTFDARRPMPAWMRRIALNKCRDWSRRRQVRRFFFQADHLGSVAAQTLAVDDSPRDDAHDRTLTDLDAAIAALPSALKEPLILTVFEGLSQKEAALTLGVSAKAVETRLYRARHMLAIALERIKGGR